MANELLIVEINPEVGIYGAPATGLDNNTTYYYRSFAEEGSGGKVSYGGALSFTTLLGDIDLPSVVTDEVYDISETSASCSGNVTDDGGGTVSRRGFCISQQENPTIDDIYSENGSGTGEFTNRFLGLTVNTMYYVRAFAENSKGIAYGNQLSFTTQNGGGPSFEWLFYDDGTNYESIGLTDGGDFDVAIKFEPEQIQNYDGWKITKFKFFPINSFPTTYSFEVYTGNDGTNLEYLQDVLIVTPNEWNEVILDDPYIIDASKPLYPGYWIQNQPMGEFPAGTDDGPAITGSGDLISLDGVQSWIAISIANPDLDYNWNLQIYITNASGEEQLLVPGIPDDPHKKIKNAPLPGISSSNQSNR